MPESIVPENLKTNDICILGIPFDDNSSFRKGSGLAPARIRESLFSPSSNLWSEQGIDLGSLENLHDLGDLNCSEPDTLFDRIGQRLVPLVRNKARMICLGGDHSITFPIIQAHAQEYPNLNILHLDAHPDLYNELDNNRFSHACPFARIMENKLAERVVQAGIRTMNGLQKDQATRLGVEVIEMKMGIEPIFQMEFQGPLYLSLDMDCLDPAFAPGVSHHEPGGLSTRQVIELIQRVKCRLIGADIVEYNPERDLMSMTSMTAAKLLKEIISRIYLDNRR